LETATLFVSQHQANHELPIVTAFENSNEVGGVRATVRRLDGNGIDVERQTVPIRHGADGDAVLEVLREVSSPPKPSAQQRHNEILVGNIVDTAMDGIISINAKQEIVLFNRASEIIFGWRKDQIIG